MECTDHELIRRTLSGDQEAFTHLVKRYQERVHALAWRKTDDFHVAEEITQDTFLRAYKHLRKLKNPNLFAGWIYVIANRLCDTWLKKRTPDIESLDNLPTVALEEQRYAEYMEKQLEERASEKRVDLVKRLLKKLPESERIVITLHYLAGSSVKEISDFLGVSSNTVKSRLYRARQRLKKEEHMVSETLGSIQPPITLTENIMRTIKDTEMQIDPAAPSTNKPIIPWAIATSTLILVALMIGIGMQNLAHFQQPYSLDAPSEMAVDIVEATVMMNLPSDPDVQNQIGSVDAQVKSEGTSQNPDAKLSSSLTGRIVDEAGNPIDGVNIAITPVQFVNGGWFPRRDENGILLDPAEHQASTDLDGAFTITNTVGGTAQLTLYPYQRAGMRILKVQIAGMFFYPHGKGDQYGIVFTIPTDKHVEDLQIILEHPRIRGKVVNIDGTPIAHTEIQFITETFNGHGATYVAGTADTDAEGYFVDYWFNNNRYDKTSICWMSATYQEQTVNAKPFFLKPGNHTHNVVFIFGGSLQPPLLIRKEGFTTASLSANPIRQDVWIINPENGHAYKRIRCENWNNAKTKATVEGAYLVTINDESEQKWLGNVFKTTSSFIGLNDISQEGHWTWDNGEPLTYTNWRDQEPHDTDKGDEDYVIMGYAGKWGKWEDINPRSRRGQRIQTALIEREELPH